MPVNKNALVRYRILDRCFRNIGRRYTIKDLYDILEEARCGVSQRQIYDDIKFMESEEGWSIELEDLTAEDGKTKYYRYADTHFSIDNKPLSENELQILKDVVFTLNQFRGLPQFDWLCETMTRLDDIIYTNHDDRASEIMGFDQNIYLKGIDEYLPELFYAIKFKTVLKISYRTFKSKEFTWTIHPYYLKQYNNRWFLFGLNENGQISNLAIDRIESIEQTSDTYIPNEEIDFNEYFDDIIGVSFEKENGNKTKILLQFDKERWPYVTSKPLHHSQIEKDKSKCIIEINVKINNELISNILSFGNQVTVIEPVEFKEQIRQILQQGLKNYI